jgi:hypothetical protein
VKTTSIDCSTGQKSHSTVDGPLSTPESEVLTSPASERLAALETEVRGMQDRAAATAVTNADAVKVRDAIVGPDAR